MDLLDLTIKEANAGLLSKKFSAQELLKTYLDKISSKDKDISAFLTITGKLAISQAKEIDNLIKEGKEISPLAGIPCAIKDNIMVQGERCSAGSKILENYTASYDATVVKRLKSKGAVIIGKTNMDEFAMGSSTENSGYFSTKNPYDLSRVPGGSSGGSAAAVAARMAIYSLGSDTGGSIRQPASFCGVVGLKPTYGAVSRYGLIAFASSLDQIGPLTKTVEDAKIVFEAISGEDPFDSTSVRINKREKANKELKEMNYPAPRGGVSLRASSFGGFHPSRPKGRGILAAEIKIGVPKEYFVKGIDSEVEDRVKEAIKKIESLGFKIKEISLPHTEYALACYYIIAPSEASANLARYDGIKYGFSAASNKEGGLLDVYKESRGEGFGMEVRRRIMLGTYSLSSGYYDAYYLRAQKVRNLIKEDFNKAFEKVDLIVTPVTPTPAFKIGEKATDPLQMYLSDIFTVSVNIAGLPAISLPCGKVGNLPVGLQIIGNYFEEDKIFGLGEVFEKSNS